MNRAFENPRGGLSGEEGYSSGFQGGLTFLQLHDGILPDFSPVSPSQSSFVSVTLEAVSQRAGVSV